MRLPGRQRTRTQFKVCDFVAARGRGWEAPGLREGMRGGSRCRRGRCEKKLTEDGIGGYHAHIRCTHLRRSSSSRRSGPAEEESEGGKRGERAKGKGGEGEVEEKVA